MERTVLILDLEPEERAFLRDFADRIRTRAPRSSTAREALEAVAKALEGAAAEKVLETD